MVHANRLFSAPWRLRHGAAIALAVCWLGCDGLATRTWAAEDGKPDSPRAMFRALGVADRYFDRLADGKPLSDNEEETVYRVLFRLRTFPLGDMQRWALPREKLATLLRQPEMSRGTVISLRGRVIEVKPMRPPPEAAERYELAKYYRCRLKLASDGRSMDVYTEEVPRQWQRGAKPDDAVGAFGVFLKIADRGQLSKADASAAASAESATVVFAAPRLAWYPANLLGKLGMDFGLFDSVKDQKPILPAEREAFYQLLAAVGRAAPDELHEAASKNLRNLPKDAQWIDRQRQRRYSVVPLFNAAAGQRGELVELLGTARRVEKIVVADADIVARFGIDHYYQISLFTDDSEGNPLTFCVRELPEGMPFGNLPRYGETVRIAGFFFKTWSYVVPKMTDPTLPPNQQKPQRQLSPMLIGRSLLWYPAPPPADRMLSNILIGVLLILAMAIIWLVVWRSNRQDGQWRPSADEEPLFDYDDGDEVESPHDGAPDFSRLAEMDRGPPKDF